MTLSLQKFISSLHSVPKDQAVMLVLVMKTAAADTSNLSGNQLLSSAVLEIKCPSGKVIEKILLKKRLFKKQNSKRKSIHNMRTN